MKASYFDLTALGWKGKILDAISKILNSLNFISREQESLPSKYSNITSWVRGALTASAIGLSAATAQAGSYTTSYSSETDVIGKCTANGQGFQLGKSSGQWIDLGGSGKFDTNPSLLANKICPDAPVASNEDDGIDWDGVEGFTRRTPTAEEIAHCDGLNDAWSEIRCHADKGNLDGVKKRETEIVSGSAFDGLAAGVGNCDVEMTDYFVSAARIRRYALEMLNHKDWSDVEGFAKYLCNSNPKIIAALDRLKGNY